MGAVVKNSYSSKTLEVVQNAARNWTTVALGFEDHFILDNILQNGNLTINGKSYRIISNSSRWSVMGWYHSLVVQSLFPNVSRGTPCTYTDDDDYRYDEAGLPAPLPKLDAPAMVLPRIQPIYTPSYILLVDANTAGWNTRQNLPFSLNEPALSPEVVPIGTSSFDNYKDLSDSPNFWAHLVSFGYQPQTGQDGDPDPERALCGGTPKLCPAAKGLSVIFVESVREDWGASYAAGTVIGNRTSAYKNYWDEIAGDIGHEIGHSPLGHLEDTDHNEHGLMEVGNIHLSELSKDTIQRFRTATSWSP